MDFTEDDAQSLAEKLDRMDLTDGERAALDVVFEAASEDDVSGFRFDTSTSSYLPTMKSLLGGEIGIPRVDKSLLGGDIGIPQLRD